MTIKAKCRNCDKEVPADQFKLHYKYKMMVCPDCFRGKTQLQKEKAKAEQEKPSKPAGWDMDDEYLQKVKRQRDKEQPQFQKVPGTEHLQCTCHNCKYSFKYDPFRKRPRSCPFCNEDIPKLNTYSLL
jgi:hypothetical protein